MFKVQDTAGIQGFTTTVSKAYGGGKVSVYLSVGDAPVEPKPAG